MEEEVERKEKEEFLTKRLNIFLFFWLPQPKNKEEKIAQNFMAFPFPEHSAYGLVLQKRSIAHRVYCIFAVLLVEASFVYDL